MSEPLDEELRRLVKAYRWGERQNRQEAWNLIADFAIENCDAICDALKRSTVRGG